jgi:hypothetical protein
MEEIESPIAAPTQVELNHGHAGARGLLHDAKTVLDLRGRKPSSVSANDRLLGTLWAWRSRLLPEEGGGSGAEQKRSKDWHLVSITVPLDVTRDHLRRVQQPPRDHCEFFLLPMGKLYER